MPTLVVIINWDNYSENDPEIWYDKIFNKDKKSVNEWYMHVTNNRFKFVPVKENSGTENDGIITVSMGKNHIGDIDAMSRELKAAIQKSEVNDNIDFSIYDTDGNGAISYKELQIIFIVAGGEAAISDSADHSIWAFVSEFYGDDVPTLDGVDIMGNGGNYARFGAMHGNHKATIGVIVHELGHSAFSLKDYYDTGDGHGSGLGYFDVMSAGGWAWKYTLDAYMGATPTQFSAYNKLALGVQMNEIDVNSTQENIEIKCSAQDIIKLQTSRQNEYFLLECRDVSYDNQKNSDASFWRLDDKFHDKLFAVLYHVDTSKNLNSENGVQTKNNHYRLGVVEKDNDNSLRSTSTDGSYSDVYRVNDNIPSNRLKFYDGVNTNYSIDILQEDLNSRTMTFTINKN